MRATKTVVLLGLLTAACCVIGQASAASPATRSLRCALHARLKTGQIAPTGALVGSVSCGHRLGTGSYHGRYRDNVNPSPFIGSEAGSSKLSFEAGAIRGTYAIDQTLISGTAPYRGTFHIIGGTRRFRRASGTLRMTCAHRIPALTDCTVSGPVSGI